MPVKLFLWKSVNIWRRYGLKFAAYYGFEPLGIMTNGKPQNVCFVDLNVSYNVNALFTTEK